MWSVEWRQFCHGLKVSSRVPDVVGAQPYATVCCDKLTEAYVMFTCGY